MVLHEICPGALRWAAKYRGWIAAVTKDPPKKAPWKAWTWVKMCLIALPLTGAASTECVPGSACRDSQAGFSRVSEEFTRLYGRTFTCLSLSAGTQWEMERRITEHEYAESRTWSCYLKEFKVLTEKSENVAKRVISLRCMTTFLHYFEVKQGEKMTKCFFSYLKLAGKKKPETKSECLSAWLVVAATIQNQRSAQIKGAERR